jgi:hypothetical protein
VNPAEYDSGDEAEEDNRPLASAAVLAGLQNLRGIANSAAKYANNVGSASSTGGGSFLSAKAWDQRKENLNPQRASAGVASSSSSSAVRANGVSCKLLVRRVTL